MPQSKDSFFNPGAIAGMVIGYLITASMSGSDSGPSGGGRYLVLLGIMLGYFAGKVAWEVVTSGRGVSIADRELAVDGEEIRLRNPALAALLAFLMPGAGHIYQGRTQKGWMFMVCILTTYFFGFAIGGGHVVYASWAKGDVRWHYICQAPVGIVAMPALIQGHLMNRNTNEYGYTDSNYEPPFGLMAPPRRPVSEHNGDDELADWYLKRGAGYEMGTWYTMIAGLLNVLVIFDAYAGPLAIPISGNKPPPGKEDEDEESKSSDKEKS